jgi:tripeptide aminopeptidase
MIDRDRMTNFVRDLVCIDSHSMEERGVAERLGAALREIGAEVRVDAAGSAVGGTTGNVLGRLPGTKADAPALLLCAHMDTVGPGKGVKPSVADGRMRSDGTTILGGDDKSGLAVIIEALRAIVDSRAPRGDIEVAFTICEEIGLLGAKHLDWNGFRAREALVLDAPHSTQLVTCAPSANCFEFVVHGLEAHAGMAPESGISAVRVAAEAIAAAPLGRIDAQTTSNFVILEGGTATNVVPNRCVVRGEARSHDHARLDAVTGAIRRCFQDAAAGATATVDGKLVRAWIEERCEREYESMRVPEDAPIVRLVQRAASALGKPMETVTIGGGSDANVFNQRGITAVILGTGMRDVHTVKEWLDLEDFYNSAEVLVRALTLAAA